MAFQHISEERSGGEGGLPGQGEGYCKCKIPQAGACMAVTPQLCFCCFLDIVTTLVYQKENVSTLQNEYF